MSTKLRCIVTGKTLVATKEYYSKKLQKAGSEENLHKTYICKEAKDLLLKGFTPAQIKTQLQINENIPEPDEAVIKQITTNEYGLSRNTMFSNLTSFSQPDTDTEVLDFLNNT